MPLFGKFNTPVNNAPEWVQKITNVFGKIDYEEQAKDHGHALADEHKLIPAHGNHGDVIGTQYYGNIRRYINYEEPNKLQKIRLYRLMADYPEIKYALNMICDELINHSDLDGNVGELIIKNKDLLENLNIKANLKKEWNYIFNELLDFRMTGRDATLSYLISGELVYEKVINTDVPTEGIKRVKRLAPDNVFPVWEEDYNDIKEFSIRQGINTVGTFTIPKSQLAYASWDHFAQNADTGEIYVMSYLEPVKKVWRQLQLLEEALVIYRIVRAPERRVFKIATGNMPPQQAQAYIEKCMRKYRQKSIYNTSTGEIDGNTNIMSMLEDYWFSQPQDGNATQVDTLQSGATLGEITDVNYFLEKLYRALEIPANRRLETFSGDQKYNNGSIGDISWQEVKFSKMVNRVRMDVTKVIYDIFKTHLVLKGLWKQYGLKDSDLYVELNKNNYFEELKRAEIEKIRLESWGTVSSYIGDVFSKEMAVKHYLKWTDEQWLQNKTLLEQEQLEGDGNVEGGSGGGGGGLTF